MLADIACVIFSASAEIFMLRDSSTFVYVVAYPRHLYNGFINVGEGASVVVQRYVT